MGKKKRKNWVIPDMRRFNVIVWPTVSILFTECPHKWEFIFYKHNRVFLSCSECGAVIRTKMWAVWR